MRTPLLLGAPLLLGLLSGCAGRPASSDAEGSSSDGGPGTTGVPPSPSTGLPDDTGISTGTPATSTTGFGSTSSDDGMSSAGFLCNLDDDHWYCQPDGSWPVWECDPWGQDCPDGEKCMPWANDGGSIWNATRCTPVDPMPAGVGAECTVVGSAVSGIDDCAPGSMCWQVDPNTNIGECVPICGGNEARPVCDEPGTACGIFNEGAITLCLPECDPLASACGEGRVCVPGPSEDLWLCVPGRATPLAPGAGCEVVNDCEAGAVCADPVVTPGCAGPNHCCASLCSLDVGSCPDMASTCAPWHSPGTAPPGQELVGICAVDPMPPKQGWVGSYVTSLSAFL